MPLAITGCKLKLHLIFAGGWLIFSGGMKKDQK
jgi:hypothetical protein